MPETRPEIRAAREPLTPTEFKRALEQGLGRAILCLQKHDPAPYRSIILEACLTNSTRDPHCWKTKAAYLLEGLNAFEDVVTLKTEILERYLQLPLEGEEQPDPELVLELAREKHPGAREALYERFINTPLSEIDWTSGQEIVDLDELDGLLNIAQRFGAALQNDPNCKPPWFQLRDLNEEIGPEGVMAAFHQKDDPLSNLYFAHATVAIQQSRKRTHRDPSRASLRWIKRGIIGKENISRVSLRIWGASASQDDLLDIAQSISHLKIPWQLARALSVFDERPFPLDYSKLIPLLWHGDEYVIWQTAKALSHFTDPQIRKMSLQLRRNPETLRESLFLLEQNFLEEDWDWLDELTRSLTDDETESLNIRIRDVIEANPSPRAQTTLIQLYESGSCAMCRSAMTALLHELNCVPDWMLEELQKDSYSYIREKVRAWATAA